METDEEDTHTRLQRLKLDVIGPIVTNHAGSVLKDMGDGFLAVFDSPSRAVQCAVALQTARVDQAADYPPERRIVFRLGLNICEAIVEVGDVFGDGVNIAARLQAYAEPGDIVLAAPLAELVQRQLEAMNTFDLGELQLRNINRPVRALGVRVGSLRNLTAPPPTGTSAAGADPPNAALCQRAGDTWTMDERLMGSASHTPLAAITVAPRKAAGVGTSPKTGNAIPAASNSLE
jgi:class 3 adenylate cyclase